MSEENEKKSFKVKDKRRFDEEGNEKLNSEPSKTSPESEAGVEPDSQPDSGFEFREPASGPEINFSSFIVSLGTQALMQLGEIAPPAGVSVPKDKLSARQTIDIIAMLREKTKGNLEDTEDRLIEELLHSLRMAFVQAK